MKNLILLISLVTLLLHAEEITLPKRLVEVTPTKTKTGTLSERFTKYTDCFCAQKTLEIASDAHIEISNICADFDLSDPHNVDTLLINQYVDSCTYTLLRTSKPENPKNKVGITLTPIETGLYRVEIQDYQWNQKSTHFMVSDSLSKELKEITDDCGDFDG